jgi:hypothetical protein
MARCARCDSLVCFWDVGACPHCNFPEKDRRHEVDEAPYNHTHKEICVEDKISFLHLKERRSVRGN